MNNQTTIRTTGHKASIAAQFLFCEWNDVTKQCVYKDDSTGDRYICNSEEEIVELYNLITSDDSDTRQDAYSIWRAQTSHNKIAD